MQELEYAKKEVQNSMVREQKQKDLINTLKKQREDILKRVSSNKVSTCSNLILN